MSTPSIGILDLGAANRANVARAIERSGARVSFVRAQPELDACDALVLPGVAHLGYIAAELDRLALRAPLLRAVGRGVPLLGICAGYQLLFEGSDEAPQARGLGIFDGHVRALRTARLPHMGWNRVERSDGSADWAYFAHTFAPPISACAIATTELDGERFVSAARRGAVLGVQFHPERSGAYGRGVLDAFVTLAREASCLQSA